MKAIGLSFHVSSTTEVNADSGVHSSTYQYKVLGKLR